MGARLQAPLGLSLGAGFVTNFVFNAPPRVGLEDEHSLEDELGAEGVAYSSVDACDASVFQLADALVCNHRAAA